PRSSERPWLIIPWYDPTLTTRWDRWVVAGHDRRLKLAWARDKDRDGPDVRRHRAHVRHHRADAPQELRLPKGGREPVRRPPGIGVRDDQRHRDFGRVAHRRPRGPGDRPLHRAARPRGEAHREPRKEASRLERAAAA